MSLLLLFSGSGGAAPVDPGPGGGGHGGPMPDAFFKRYTPDYKPTLRKQKP